MPRKQWKDLNDKHNIVQLYQWKSQSQSWALSDHKQIRPRESTKQSYWEFIQSFFTAIKQNPITISPMKELSQRPILCANGPKMFVPIM